ncbi:Hypothetical_protein [Hexamita inflata]|uniref:Hypothetical_protein n=1 Tax=Hexamita inflata TaxID=28002 RepID=A0ABP1KV10_9EUKA
MSDASFSEQKEPTEKPIKYRSQFYMRRLQGYNMNQLLQVDKTFNLLSTRDIDFSVRPESTKCKLDRFYTAEVGDLFDAPQLYKTFEVNGRYFGQILEFIYEFGDQVFKVGQIPQLIVETSERGYGRMCLFDKKLILSSGETLYLMKDMKSEMVYKQENADFMIFSCKNLTIAFDLNSQQIFELSYDQNKQIKLKFLCETEVQQVLFQNKYLILSDNEYPHPTIQIFNFKSKTLKTISANWFQDAFWDFLRINEFGDLEVDEEVETVIKNSELAIKEGIQEDVGKV